MNNKNTENTTAEITEKSLRNRFKRIADFLFKRKTYTAATALLTVLCVTTATLIALSAPDGEQPRSENSTAQSAGEGFVPAVSSENTAPEASSEAVPSSSAEAHSSAVSSAAKPSIPSTPAVSSPPSGGFKYNTNLDMEDNVFFDALIYTGYNIEKHRADGNMWKYILASSKRGLNYLSDITYAGGSTGYETVNGRPDIGYFEKHGLVCASYVTYVYFNYLPNVAGIDTSSLTKPVRSTSANDWYSAAKDWIKKGYSRKISFTAKNTPSAIKFYPSEDIPIGSIIAFCDGRNKSDYCGHAVIYAGCKNGYHWVFHVGNANGPEFCAVERMKFGHDPQWPIAVITPPANIRMSAMLEVSVSDADGNPVSGSRVTLTNSKTGAVTELGVTGSGGKLVKEGLSYGGYILNFTVPDGFTADGTAKSIELTTASNSKNTVNITLTADPPAIQPPSVPEDTSGDESSSENSGSQDTSSGTESGEGTPSEDTNVSDALETESENP